MVLVLGMLRNSVQGISIHEMRTNENRQLVSCKICITRIADMKAAEAEEEEDVYVPPPPVKKMKIVYCGTPIGFSFCQKPRGHLGHCCM